MGDLTPGQARAFFAGLLQQVQAGSESGPAFQMERDWPAVRSVCGGNIGLLKRALEGLVSYGNLDAGAAPNTGRMHLQQGFVPDESIWGRERQRRCTASQSWYQYESKAGSVSQTDLLIVHETTTMAGRASSRLVRQAG